ncbi:MAG: AAA family ATPase [Armatimonadetes bacterium]|nr:AAA family ATPase [Armatimonadota bacterium]
MITRIYIDNYKCFSNFEYRPAANELLLGRNGVGKSSVFDVLRMLRGLVYDGTSIADSDCLGLGTRTIWDTRENQLFELEVAGNGGAYHYSLSIEYDEEKTRSRIGVEELKFSPRDSAELRLFRRERDEGWLFRDNGSDGPEVRLDWNRSGLFSIQPRHDNTRLTWFKERLGQTHCIRVVPAQMSGWTEREDDAPDSTLSNLSSWYRHLNQEEPRVRDALHRSLQAVIDGFSTFSLRRVTEEGRRLVVELESEGSPHTYDLSQLSDGQRALIGLYTLSAYASQYPSSAAKSVTLCVDEPENFVALSELQPWIHEMEDCVDGERVQLLLASHHPEFINHYAHTSAVLLYRVRGGPTRVRAFDGANPDGLAPAEIVARGWEDE